MGAAQQIRGFAALYSPVGNLNLFSIWTGKLIINGVFKKGAESPSGAARSLEEGFKYLDKLLSVRAADEISRKKTAAGT